MKNQRESGIELLRIFAAVGVIIIHLHDQVGRYIIDDTFNYYFLIFLKSLAICSVDVFILISGYFLCTNNKRQLGKVVSLIFQITVFNVLLNLFHAIYSGSSISIISLFHSLLPVNYFIYLYVTLYLISPWMNIIIDSLSPKQWKLFIIVSLLLFSIYPTLYDLSQELLNVEWWGMSTITAWGNFQGFNIVNFMLLYFIGAAIRKCNIIDFLSSKKLLLINVLIIFLWAVICEHLSHHGMRSSWVYHNPMVIAESAILFSIFKKYSFSSICINRLAGACFTCYLINSNLMRIIKIEQLFTNITMFTFIIRLLICLVLIYVLSFIFYLGYAYISKPIEKLFNKLTIIYR